MIWARSARGDASSPAHWVWRSLLRISAAPRPEEWRVREFLLNEPACSETADSLASKLGLSRKRCRRALEGLVSEGLMRRREFADIEPIYYRYPGH